MKKSNRLIVGSVLGLAAIAVAIDHTRHRLPDPVPVSQEQMGTSEQNESSPCGLDSSNSPCSMSETEQSESSPCSL
jgi:hypothetical protein